jgi:UDP-2-acetamido-2,6-beta-L-arabino-hexul-4-ose reductase
VLSSSTQATLDNPYGVSKRLAEETVFAFGSETGARVAIFRFPGVFGKWCRPNYNSVVATFCYNIAHDLPITISDPAREIELIYIDDVIAAFIKVMDGQRPSQGDQFCYVEPTFHVTLGNLAETIRSFRESRNTLLFPAIWDRFTRSLYATYVSYLPNNDFGYHLMQRVDQRGELTELFKSFHFGQVFVSRTRPGITRGNHYHDTKVEKFAVLEGEAVIRLRHILGPDVIDYPVSGKNFQVVDIPPGYTHSIENVGQTDLIVLFWADEIFDPSSPDTYPLKVLEEK